MNPWIKVHEKLPEMSQDIIFYTPEHDMCYAGIFAPYWKDLEDKESRNAFLENFECAVFETDEVSHWMPIEKPDAYV